MRRRNRSETSQELPCCSRNERTLFAHLDGFDRQQIGCYPRASGPYVSGNSRTAYSRLKQKETCRILISSHFDRYLFVLEVLQRTTRKVRVYQTFLLMYRERGDQCSYACSSEEHASTNQNCKISLDKSILQWMNTERCPPQCVLNGKRPSTPNPIWLQPSIASISPLRFET